MDGGLRQRDAARQIGVTAGTVRNWELGHTNPSLRAWPRILDFLGFHRESDRSALRDPRCRGPASVGHPRV